MLVAQSVLALFCFIVAVTATDKKSHLHHGHDLSDQDHDDHGAHNSHYDQDALFGRDEAKRLDELSPEEGTNQLRLLVKKMDTDHDGFVTPEELRAWLRKIQNHMSLTDAKRVWEEHNLTPDQNLSWELYSTKAVQKDGLYEDEDKDEQQLHLARDKVRWAIADDNKDGELSLQEAVAFLNPEADPRMQDALAQETIDDMDKNKDGFIDIEEYVTDLWKPTDSERTEPDWIKSEREDFVNARDLNKDGKLDHAEVKQWRFSPAFDYVENEVQHLLEQCDTDKDMRLTEDEIVSHYNVLMGSAATNYGDALGEHDEL